MAASVACAAEAACPTERDLSTGIRLDYPDGYSIFKRDDDGVVTEEEHAGDDVFLYVSSNGMIETSFRDSALDESDHFTYTFDTQNLVPPQPWSGARGEQVTLSNDGDEVERVAFSYYTRGERNFLIGSCRYASIAFQTYQHFEDEVTMIEFVYLLDLAVPVPVGFGGDGYFDPYRPMKISAVGQ